MPQVMDLLGPSLWDTWNQNNQQCAPSPARLAAAVWR